MPKANQVLMKEEKRLNVILPVKTHTDFKTAAAAQGKNMTDVLIEFIHEYVQKYGVEPKKKGRR